MSTGRLDPAERRRALDRLTEGELDVLVVGGGVVGAGAALDAATRGLTVGLLERRDWASGTSSRSSRLAHGGLRYLEQLEFGLVHEALSERGLLLDKLAPHLVRPVPFLLPLTRGWQRPYVGAGVALYDVLSRVSRRGGALPGHRHLSRTATLNLAPGLNPEALTGAIGFFDAQIDDVRHTLALVRTAVAHGALATSGVEVTRLLRDGERVLGVEAVDRDDDRRLTIRARRTIAAMGVWTDGISAMLQGDSPRDATVQPSKGVHLVVPRDAIDLRTAVIARTPASVLFLLPWGPHWLVGTTDTPWSGDRDEPVVTADDVDYLLDQANRWLVRPLGRDDIVSTYVGLRPLLAGDADEETSKLSREHAVGRPAPGLVTITGGKYTTYRVMAADAVDAAVSGLSGRVPPSRTSDVVLLGAENYAEVAEQRDFIAAEAGLPEPKVRRLLHRYGDLVPELLALADDDPSLLQAAHPDSWTLNVELLYAVSHEGARSLDDILRRRTRVALQTRDRGASVAEAVAELVSPVLGWDADRATEEVRRYQQAVAQQIASVG